MNNRLYSIRMRASLKGGHVSGAERIVAADKIDTVMSALVDRALSKASAPDQVVVTLECLDGIPPRIMTALDVVTLNVPDVQTGRNAAIRVLRMAGVSESAASTAISLIRKGASPSGGAMRGATIMDALSGERLEPDQERGVRVSRFDWSAEASDAVDQCLAAAGLIHFRTREALALATKVAHGPGIVAELCWSDDPCYQAGYVASLQTGYVRFPFLKDNGDPNGGRVFFIDRHELNKDTLMQYLEREAVLVTAPDKCRDMTDAETYFAGATVAN